MKKYNEVFAQAGRDHDRFTEGGPDTFTKSADADTDARILCGGIQEPSNQPKIILKKIFIIS